MSTLPITVTYTETEFWPGVLKKERKPSISFDRNVVLTTQCLHLNHPQKKKNVFTKQTINQITLTGFSVYEICTL